MNYTASKILQYEQCPLKFKFKFIDKVKVPRKECFVKGSKIHSVLEKYKGESLTESNEVNKFFESTLGKEIKEILSSETKRELRIAVDKDFKPIKYNSKDYLLRGIVDLVYIKDGILNIVDYKSGKYVYPKYQDFTQLMVYALYFFNNQKINKINLRYVYVESSKENSMLLNKSSCDEIKRSLLSRIAKIENDKTFEKNVSWCCKFCEYAEHCSKV